MKHLLLRLFLLLACLPGLAAAELRDGRLVLHDDQGVVEAWPAVTMLADAEGRLALPDVLRRQRDFVPPSGPAANLGVRRDVVWLRVPLSVPATETGRWLLDIDYPSLDRAEVTLVTEGKPVRTVLLGDAQPFTARPMATRSHAVALQLEPVLAHELLIRVQTTSSMIVPIALIKDDRYHAREARFQMVQGVMAGLGLCLMVYSLMQWLSQRDITFLHYALSLLAISTFFFGYHGLGMQHLWGGSDWLAANMAPLAVLVALVGGMLFLERALEVAAFNPRLSQAMKLTAGLAGASALGFLLGIVDYRGAHLAGTVLGPMPIVMGLPAAVARVRLGDRASIYIVLGWGVYGLGIITMALLLRGLVESNVWTQNAFQAGAMLEMVAWQRVLAMRLETLRRLAEQADRERASLHSLAHSDPLTGLPNRRGLQIELDNALPRADAQRMLAVYMLDLDGFKAVNDRLGHDTGDLLLKAVAQRLRQNLRHRDVVARLGGDEFVVMATDLPGDEEAQRVGRKLLEAFEAPFDLNGQSCRVGLTIGYALAPLDGADDASLLKRADAAMYAGKQAGKHCLRRGGASAGLVGV